MKTKLPLYAALYCGLSTFASAFSLDFSGRTVGEALPLTINVPLYGDVEFTPSIGTLQVGTFTPPAGTKAISFDAGEMINVTFKGATPIGTSFQYIGVGAGESFAFDAVPGDPKKFWLQFSGPTGSTGGLQSVTFDVVPEPSTSLLGALGCALLVIRRKR